MDNIITPKIELAVRSLNALSGLEVAKVTANSERGKHVGITVAFENVSDGIITFHELNKTDDSVEVQP